MSKSLWTNVVPSVVAAVMAFAMTLEVASAELLLDPALPMGTTVFRETREWGYDFTVGGDDLVLSRLGAYDRGLDGLAGVIRVSVWDRSNSSLVASADITGLDGTLVSRWRMVDIPNVILSAAGVYSFVASTTTSSLDTLDLFVPVDATSLGTVDLSIVRWQSTTVGDLIFPNRSSNVGLGADLMPGINADISVAVPEPSTAMLMLLGLGFAVSVRKRA